MRFPAVISVGNTPVYTLLKRIRAELTEKKALYSAITAINLIEMLTTQIADALGYKSIHHFSNHFTKIVGVSPKAYIKTPKNHQSQNYPKSV